MYKILKQYVPSILIAVVISLFVRVYVAEAMKVPTGSMIPTIQVNDHLIVEKMLWLTTLEHGDIVVFTPPVAGEEENRYVKRLIGLPGDTVEIKESSLYRNGVKVEEPYLKETMNYAFGPVTVPADHYFFLGDNRNISYDAHLWDEPFVSKDELIGKVIAEIPTHVLY
ncbi:S26 family signal peptidase [Paenibacillus albidus]|uniref:Signal peptidase I n=1 Tax=Paenibacillus albidus TaxID=2041023 RepID=A0A917C568_9BACL|nr:signal peptidase I [Paenibacillus albidus]MBT2291129.1 signal peptidase I [Paenibacillus albidus]GGF71290.1 S26 family signal peptidase [Paenibacillus albidus]